MRLIRQIFFLFLICVGVGAQEPLRVTEHLLINNGLANNYITDIVEDGKGRIWAATESGLNSYDGFEFRSYNTANSGLNSNMINTLWYDHNNNKLWIGTKGNGLCVMDLNTCQIRTLGAHDAQVNNIMHISPDADDGIWIVSQTSILHCKAESEQLELVSKDNSQGFFQCVFDHRDGKLLIGHYLGGVSLMDIKSRKTKRLLAEESQLYDQSVNDIVKDRKGRTWMATSKGLWYYTPEKESLEKFDPLTIGNITDIELIDDSEIWLSSTAGVWVVNMSEWSAQRIPNLRSHGSPTHNVRKIFQDSKGNVWFGSMGNGIDFFSHEKPLFQRLCKQSIWGIYKDEDGVWAGTTDRLLCYKGTTLVREIPVGRKGWENCFVISINSDDQGHLIVSYFGHLLQIDKQNGAVKEIFLENGASIFSLTFYKDRDSTLWMTARDGIYTLRHGKVRREEQLNSVLSRQSVHGIRRDRQGKLWVATYENGIYLFDEQKRLLRRLNRQGGSLSNSIQHLHMDPQGGIWLSTPDGMGYIRDTNKPDEYQAFGYQQGLRDSYIRAIQEDEEGNIWLSTNNGISLLKPGEETFVNFNQYDGIPTNNFTGGAVEADGSLYFTSLDGLCFFRPQRLTASRKLSAICIQNCEVLSTIQNQDGQSQNRYLSPDDKGVFHLSYQQNSFRIIFGLSDYAQNRQAEYQYIVKGRDADWTNLQENAITFRNLSSGQYTIAVRARLKGQQWDSASEIETCVYIHPHFWRSWWAYLFYVCLFVGLGWFYFKRYKHRLRLQSALELERKKNIDEQERNSERLQFFTNITHELRTPLTLILGPLEELKEDKSLPKKVSERITMIHRSSEQLKNLITQLLEFRKTETHNRRLTVMRQDLAQTVRKIGNTFSQLNTNANVNYLINTGESPLILYYDENVVTTILNNLMNNAAKYTPKGEIELSLEDRGQQVVVSVRDTGYGIAEEALSHIFDRYYQAKGAHQASGTGIGLALVKSLATLHEAEILVESKEGKGAKFALILKKDNTYPQALHQENSEDKVQTEIAVDEVVENESHRPVILVVEDNTEIRRYIASSLGDDYKVIKAADGKVGCEKAFEHIPDLIITDIMMPVMDGTALCKRIKQDIRTSHIPVVMLTAKDTKTDQQQGYEVGADSYLTKPFSMSMLRSRIVNLLTARQRLASYLTASTTENKKETEQQETSALSRLDRQFLSDITKFIEENITEQNITMAMIGESVHMSHSTLYRKIKALTGISGNEFIRKVRLRHSLQLMLKEHRNVSEAAFESGFNSLPYFRSCFKEEFGMTPTDYLKSL